MSGGGWGRGAAIITRALLSVWIRTAKKILSSHIGTSMLLGGGGGADARAHTQAHTHTCEQTQHREPKRKILQILVCSFSKHEGVFFFFSLLSMHGGSQKKTTKKKKRAVRLEKKRVVVSMCLHSKRRPLSVWLLGKT